MIVIEIPDIRCATCYQKMNAAIKRINRAKSDFDVDQVTFTHLCYAGEYQSFEMPITNFLSSNFHEA